VCGSRNACGRSAAGYGATPSSLAVGYCGGNDRGADLVGLGGRGGCDKESEVRSGWQPVLGWVSALLLLAPWLAEVGVALLARQWLTRRTG
jgi:hypothetical protein